MLVNKHYPARLNEATTVMVSVNFSFSRFLIIDSFFFFWLGPPIVVTRVDALSSSQKGKLYLL